jgi:pyridinium-3,5-biscarboxylic acid mononucleotide synthase
MDKIRLKMLLDAVSEGSVSAVEAVELVAGEKPFGYVDLGHTRLDTDRRRRRGVSEAIFCEGKTPDQIREIARRLDAANQNVLCTRVVREVAEEIFDDLPGFSYDPTSRLLYKVNEEPNPGQGRIAVITAGTTDIPVAEEAAKCLEIWGDPVDRIYDVGVAGLHRLLSVADTFSRASVVITVAGMEAALTSVVAGLVRVPVVAVPSSVGYGTGMKGVVAMLGMLNSCSGGIGTVNIDNGFGGALLAHMINQVGMPGSAAVPGTMINTESGKE